MRIQHSTRDALVRLIILVGVVLVLIGLVRWVRGRESTFSSLSDVASFCQNKTDETVDYACVRRRIVTLVQKGDTVGLLGMMQRNFSEPARNLGDTARCTGENAVLRHAILHVIGEVAFAQKIPMDQIYSACVNVCDFGCFHGAFNAKLRSDGDFLRQPDSFCRSLAARQEKADLRSCYHVLGHGIAEYYGRDKNTVLAVCDRMREENFRRDCFDGVLMESLGILSATRKTVPVDAPTLLAVCQAVPARYQKYCFESIGAYGHYLFSDKEAAVEICEQVPAAFGVSCAAKVGNKLFYLSVPDIGQFVASCGPLSGALYGECIAVGVQILKTKQEGMALAENLCRQVKPEFIKECYAIAYVH